MKHFWILLLCGNLSAQFELPYRENKTPEYHEVINYYRQLDSLYEQAVLLELSSLHTDSPEPLHLFLMSSGTMAPGDDPALLIKDKAVLLINNGIHPGESCGIDASLLLARDMLKEGIPGGFVIGIIPVYNIGGALNRGSHSRANQHGPQEHGSRGNGRNLDLNRDFIKADARNTQSFHRIFHLLKPHIFVDTHTSNGADYQYTMTLLTSQKDKLNPVLAQFLGSELEPFLYNEMKQRGWEMTPYVNVFRSTPDQGFSAFMDSPRYATGYTALFNTIGFTTEAHMLKPYADRVEATYAFLKILAGYAAENAVQLQQAKSRASQKDQDAKMFSINWQLDSSVVDTLSFKGYAYEYQASQIGDYKRLKYHPDQPVTYQVPYFPRYKAVAEVEMPQYYVLPQAWGKVVMLLQHNEVEMQQLRRDTLFTGRTYYLDSVQFAKWPYEGHFPITDLTVRKEQVQQQFHKGDYVISVNENNKRFLAAVLEPHAIDSYLRWNFFDEIFQQKEYFSAYVFEDTALELLKNNPELRREFDQWKSEHPQLLQNPYAVLGFIYRRSPYYEKGHMRYPVLRGE